MDEIKSVTISTDISHCPQTKIGTYCFVLLGEGIRIVRCDKFKNNCDNSYEAELKCVINAVSELLWRPLPKIKNIHIVTDCLLIVQRINKSKEKGEHYIMLRGLLKQLKKKTKCSHIQFKHCKAHTSNSDRHSLLNKYCDKKSRKKLKEIKKLTDADTGDKITRS